MSLILVIDLDNTIIGNCLYQQELYNIYLSLKENKVRSTNILNALTKSYKNKHKLLRPYFISFMKYIRNKYNDIKIFVYTASTKEWADKEINIIEKANNIKFDRPIFNRNDCINNNGILYKSISNILLKLKKDYRENIENRLLIIDNFNSYIDHTDNLLLCKSYNFILYNDIWLNLLKDKVKTSIIKDNINTLIKDKTICPINIIKNEFDVDKINKIHKWNYIKTHKINEENNKYKKDVFWKKMLTFFKNNYIKDITPTVIKKLNEDCNKF